MKKVISIIMILVICLSLCSCNANSSNKQVIDPLVGKWEGSNGNYEAVFEFTEKDGKLAGSWTFYDYDENRWGEYSFEVKEKSDTAITILVDDGTMDTLTYNMLGNQLYIDGLLYINPESDAIKVDDTSRIMIVDGNNYEVYDNIYMGLHYDSVVKALPYELSDLVSREQYTEDYKYDFTCDYSTDCYVDGEYDHLSFGFDKNMQLVHISKSVYHNEKAFLDSYIRKTTAQFGEYNSYSRSSDDYSNVFYEWRYGDFIICVNATTRNGEQELAWVVVTHYYSPEE